MPTGLVPVGDDSQLVGLTDGQRDPAVGVGLCAVLEGPVVAVGHLQLAPSWPAVAPSMVASTTYSASVDFSVSSPAAASCGSTVAVMPAPSS